MLKKTILFVYIFCFSLACFGQEEGFEEKLKSLKIGMISSRLQLTSEQAKVFWPVFEEFETEKKALQKEMMDMKKNEISKTDAELQADLNKILDLKAKDVEIERKYVKKFSSVITVKQVLELYRAEMHFKKMLLDRLGKRKEQRERKDFSD